MHRVPLAVQAVPRSRAYLNLPDALAAFERRLELVRGPRLVQRRRPQLEPSR